MCAVDGDLTFVVCGGCPFSGCWGACVFSGVSAGVVSFSPKVGCLESFIWSSIFASGSNREVGWAWWIGYGCYEVHQIKVSPVGARDQEDPYT